jgi:hypothetical protein
VRQTFAVAPKARRIEPAEPEPIEGASARWDYADAFELSPAELRSAEAWARATLEAGPTALRWFVVAGWKTVLRLRLGPGGSEQHVAGWPIVLRTPEVVVLEVASGALGRARLTFRTTPGRVSASSNIAYERPGARAMWWAGGVLHRRILPYLLTHAAASSPA